MDSDKQPKRPTPTNWELIGIAGEFGYLIAVPLLIAIFVGKWLDGRFGTRYFVLIGLGIALGISSFAIYKSIRRLLDIFRS